MHYDWKNETSYDGIETEMIWWDEALSNELGSFLEIIIVLNVICWIMYPEPEALSYEIFMWGDVGLVTDVRFYGVAPHWYFRPYMAWLIVCPHHNLGIFGMVYLFWVLFNQPTLHGMFDTSSHYQRRLLLFRFIYKKNNFYTKNYFNSELSLYFQFTYTVFIMCALYTASFLPYGRFYNRLGGNVGMLASYMYVLCYLTFTFLRRPVWLELYHYHLFNKVSFLSKAKKEKLNFKKKFLPKI